MSLVVPTGETRIAPCSKCGLDVEQRQKVAYRDGGEVEFWSTARHNAPCGLQCFGGGVFGADYALKNAHGAVFPCPRCG